MEYIGTFWVVDNNTKVSRVKIIEMAATGPETGATAGVI